MIKKERILLILAVLVAAATAAALVFVPRVQRTKLSPDEYEVEASYREEEYTPAAEEEDIGTLSVSGEGAGAQENAAEKKEQVPLSDRFTAGHFEGNSYINEYFGVHYEMDDDMFYYPQSTLDQINKHTINEADPDQQIKRVIDNGKDLLVAYAIDPDSMKMFQVALHFAYALKSEEQIARAQDKQLVKDSMDQAVSNINRYLNSIRASNINVRETTAYLLGARRPCVFVQAKIYDIQLNERITYMMRDGYVLEITTASYGQDKTAQMLRSITWP